MTRAGLYAMMRLVAVAWVATIVGMLIHAQVAGAPGRTTSSGGTLTYAYTPGIPTLLCSGPTCSNTSSSVSPSSHSVSGALTFNSSHDGIVSVGGSTGGGTGQLQVSCDSGSTWNAIAIGSASVGGSVSYAYPPVHCTGPTNLDSLLFRTILGGGGGVPGFNMSYSSPSQVVISW